MPPIGVLKIECTDLLDFGERSECFFCTPEADSMSVVSFLEPAPGVILVNGDGHITEF